ncbi:hypothetical protein ABT332_13525 [Saccharomonospora azurea]|uniref:hypothetical protein n=1 Tax=Saccharomonospora azurea TaxID=40988 RepID=UPI0033297E87
MTTTEYTTITNESDRHGEVCDWCRMALSITNIYAGDQMEHSCLDCVTDVIFWNPVADTVLVEVSSAPVPKFEIGYDGEVRILTAA